MRDAVVLWTIAAATVIGIVGLGFIIFWRILMHAVDRVEKTVDSSEERIRAELRAAYLVVGPPLPEQTNGNGDVPSPVPSPRRPFRVIAGGATALMLFVVAVSKAARLHPGVAAAMVAGVVLVTLPLVVDHGTERVRDIPPAAVATPPVSPPVIEPPTTEVPSAEPPPPDEELPGPPAEDLPAATTADGTAPRGDSQVEESADPAAPPPPAEPPEQPRPAEPEPPPSGPPADTVTACVLKLPLEPLVDVCLLPLPV